jgi:uncharacterized ferredoxin-like protein
MEALRHVAQLCAVAAMTAPKSGGQLFLKGSKPFIETVIVEDRETLSRLAAWLRERGKKLKDPIWFRDADTAEKLDLVLFIGLAKWYPPVYDCTTKQRAPKIGNSLARSASFAASTLGSQSDPQRK